MARIPQIQVRQRFGGIAELGVTKKIRGSCLCGGVRFEVQPPFLRAGHCHCERCRKHSGRAVCTHTRISKEQISLVVGKERVRVYGKAKGAAEAFCHVCGPILFGGYWPDGPELWMRL